MNSYHRLVPGFEAPVNLVYSQRNRSAAMRIPITGSNPKAKRVEFRAPDPSSNPYLAFSALLLAGLDGVKNKIEPAEPIDKDLYELAPEEHAGVPQVPTSSRPSSTPSRPTTSTSRPAASSPPTSSTPGSTTSAPRKSPPSSSARTRTSSSFTSISKEHGRTRAVNA